MIMMIIIIIIFINNNNNTNHTGLEHPRGDQRHSPPSQNCRDRSSRERPKATTLYYTILHYDLLYYIISPPPLCCFVSRLIDRMLSICCLSCVHVLIKLNIVYYVTLYGLLRPAGRAILWTAGGVAARNVRGSGLSWDPASIHSPRARRPRTRTICVVLLLLLLIIIITILITPMVPYMGPVVMSRSSRMTACAEEGARVLLTEIQLARIARSRERERERERMV